MRKFVSYVCECKGGVALTYAMALPPMFLLIGCGLDLLRATSDKHELQFIADSAAVHTAKEMALAGTDLGHLRSVAELYAASSGMGRPIEAMIDIDSDTLAITVQLSAAVVTNFPGPLGNAGPIKVSATAQVSGESGNLCMIGLNKSAEQTIKMNTDARLTASNCSIYSNSTNPSAFEIRQGARVKADLVCVSGGIKGDQSKIVADVLTDCPQIEDPLAERNRPFENNFDNQVNFTFLRDLSAGEIADAGCDFVDTVITHSHTEPLKPGVYCGGIVVIGGTARLKPGEYIIKDGSLTAMLGGTIEGKGVGFFLTGASSTILFTGSATIDLTAPTTGALAGMLFFEDPASPVATFHTIASDNARRLVGTVYIPQSKLLIAGSDPIADKSEYTIIVANRFELRDGPNLVLNTDYEGTDVPVPAGVGPVNDIAVKLIR